MDADVLFANATVFIELPFVGTKAVGKTLTDCPAMGGMICAWKAPPPQLGHETVIAPVAGVPEAPFT
jgi:hypothetical protein